MVAGTVFFHKYHALGNDMLVIDPTQCTLSLTPLRIHALCDRHTGIGADGICMGPLPLEDDCIPLRFFNPDGSEAEKSGNGLRIFARYLWDTGLAKGTRCCLVINGERLQAVKMDRDGNMIRVQMGRLAFQPLLLELDGLSLTATAVSLGNPHIVILSDDLSQIFTLGPQLETAPAFPQRTNVQLMQIIGQHEIRIEIWERGAGYTRSSGSSSCAAAGAAVWLGHCHSPVTVQMAGGAAIVHIDADWGAEMIGPVSPVFNGRLAADLYSRLENLT